MRSTKLTRANDILFDSLIEQSKVHAQVVLDAVIARTTPAERRRLADGIRSAQNWAALAEVERIAREAGAGAAWDESKRLADLADRLMA